LKGKGKGKRKKERRKERKKQKKNTKHKKMNSSLSSLIPCTKLSPLSGAQASRPQQDQAQELKGWEK